MEKWHQAETQYPMSPHCPNNSRISGETNFLYYQILTTTNFWPITICCSLL